MINTCGKISFDLIGSSKLLQSKFNITSFESLVEKIKSEIDVTSDEFDKIYEEWTSKGDSKNLKIGLKIFGENLHNVNTIEDFKKFLKNELTRQSTVGDIPTVDTSSTTGNNTSEENKGQGQKEDNYDLDFDEDIDRFFNNDLILKSSLKKIFRTNFIHSFLYITKSGNNKHRLVKSNEDLNESLIEYKLKLYKEIEDYILGKDPNFQKEDIYNKMGLFNSRYVDKLFNVFNEQLKSIQESDLPKLLSIGWTNDPYLSKKEPSLLKATYAYLTLKHFDSLVKNEAKDIIEIDPLYIDQDTNKFKIGSKDSFFIKYKIGSGNQNSVKNWNIGEFRDALSELSNLQNLICESLTLYDLNDNVQKLGINMSLIGQSWSALVAEITSVKQTSDVLQEIYDDILNFNNNPNEYLHKVLDKLFNKLSKDQLDGLTKSERLSIYQLDVLYSVYLQILKENNKESLTYIENLGISKRTAQNGEILLSSTPLTKYLLQDVIVNAISGMATARYLENRVNITETTSDYISQSSHTSKQVKDYVEGTNLDYRTKSIYELSQLVGEDGYDVKFDETDPANLMYITIGSNRYRVFASQGNFVKNPALVVTKDLEESNIEKLKEILNNKDYDNFGEEILNSIKQARANLTVANYSDASILKALKAINISHPNDEVSNLITILSPIKFGELNFGSINRERILRKADPQHQVLRDLVKFVDDFLQLDLNTDLGLQTLEYAVKTTPGFTPLEIFKSAFRAAYLSKLQLDQKMSKKTLDEVAVDIFKNYNELNNDFQIIDRTLGVKSFKTILNTDSWVNHFFSAQASLLGDSVQSTTNDIKKNKRANYRPTSLAMEYRHYINELANNKDAAMNEGIFQKNQQLILDVGYDSQMSTIHNDKIITKEATVSELIYNGIVNNFWNAFATSNRFHIMPTVYSDKTAFVTYAIDANGEVEVEVENEFGEKIIIKKKLVELTNDEFEQVYQKSIGTYFSKQFDAVKNDFNKLFKDAKVKEFLIKKNPDLNNYLKKPVLYDQDIQKILEQIDKSIIEESIKLYNASNDQKLQIAKEVHYRVNPNKKLSLNETLVYYVNNQFNGNGLSKRFYSEKINFLEQLINNKIKFPYNSIQEVSSLQKAVLKLSQLGVLGNSSEIDNKNFVEEFEKQWVKNGRLILAKDENGNEISLKSHISKDKKITLNPLLEKYFYIDNLTSANIKYSLLGSEISDPLKFKYKTTDSNLNDHYIIVDKVKSINPNISQSILDDIKNFDLTQLNYYIEDYGKGLDELSPTEDFVNINALMTAYNELSLEVISIGEGAQYKRNVIMPATRTPMQVNSITGLGETTKVAIIEDEDAEIFNYLGNREFEDADDGSAKINPFQAILENNSLNSKEVGYNIKKPIWYHYDPVTGTSVLLKFATFTITNSGMRQSSKSTQSLRRLFKKMTNIRFNQKFDLTNSVYNRAGKGGNHPLGFSHIIARLQSGSNLYYKDQGDVYEITDFKNVNGIYYTREKNVNDSSDSGHWVANVFNDDSEIIKIRQSEQKYKTDAEFYSHIENTYRSKYHSVDSLYEVWQAFGGIDSVEKIGDDWKDSENSCYAVVGLMNNVFEENNNPNLLQNQKNYKQPLKNYMIGYAANVSAVKRGQFNVNNKNAWTDDKTELSYVVLNNKGLGSQMDPEHEADEAEVAEMTQVMASLDVGGELHDYAKSAFQDLGKLIANGFKNEAALIDKLADITSQDKDVVQSQLYDLLAREFIRAFKSHSELDLSVNIVNRIKKYFQTSAAETHIDDDIKLPASDPNVFKSIISAFVGRVNKQAMKRRYSGQAAVMVPAYNNAQMFHFIENNNDVTLTYTDIRNKALKHGTQSIYDIEINNGIYKLKEGGEVKVTSIGDNIVEVNTENISNYNDLELTQLVALIYKNLPNGTQLKIKSNKLSQKDLDLLKIFQKFGFKNAGDTTTFITDEKINDFYGYNHSTLNSELHVIVPSLIKNSISNSKIEELLVDSYLQLEQSDEKYTVINPSDFQPTDKVNIIRGDKTIKLNLDNIDEYYDFTEYFCKDTIRTELYQKFQEETQYSGSDDIEKENLFQQWLDNGNYKNYWEKNFLEGDDAKSQQYIDKWYDLIRLSLYNDVKFQRNIIDPSNLRPQRIQFKTTRGVKYNLYDLDPIKEAHLARREINFDKRRLKGSKYYDKLFKKQYLDKGSEVDFEIYKKEQYDLLKEAGIKVAKRDGVKIQDSVKQLVQDNIALINGEKLAVQEDSIVNDAAEMLMSNIYASKYGQTNQTMYDLDHELPKSHTVLYNYPSEFVLVGNHRKKGLTFKKPSGKYIISKQNEIVTLENGVYNIYKESTETKQKSYQIGISLNVNNDHYIVDGEIYRKSDNAQIIDKNFIIRNGQVYRNVYFVQELKIKSGSTKHPVIYIDKIGCSKLNINLNELVKNIANEQKYTHIQLNAAQNLEDKNKEELINTLNALTVLGEKNRFYNEFIKQSIYFLQNVSGTAHSNITKLSFKHGDKEVNYSYLINNVQQDYNKTLKQHYALSKMVIAARIPAQSLQSYMQMKCVGYIPVSDNECMVSHWQTWLQGSDYDIDKSFIMGFEFDENGLLYDWSNLFDYSSAESLKASLELPTPNRIEIETISSESKNREYSKKILSTLSSEEIEDLKTNISYIFQNNPQLSAIGTEEDYLLYLVSKFPKSVLKSIVWHGTNADFSEGFDSALRGEGSGAPETKKRKDFYFAKQNWSVLQYIDGIVRNPDIIDESDNVKHWNRLWWALKQILGNGQEDGWQNIVVNDDTVRENIPNKKGEFNLDRGEKLKQEYQKKIEEGLITQEELDALVLEKLGEEDHGQYLKNIKEKFGYGDKSNKEFFEEVFDFKYGEETFNTYVARKKEEFKNVLLTTKVKGLVPAIVNIVNPYTEKHQDTRYLERGVFDLVDLRENDAIISEEANNEFNSDVVIITNLTDSNRNERIHFIGTKTDISDFSAFIGNDVSGYIEHITNLITKANKEHQNKNYKAENQLRALAIRKKAELIRHIESLSKDGKVSVINTFDDKYKILEAIKYHENYQIPSDDFEKSIKNSVSGRVQQIVSNPKNIVKAYSPITMSDLSKAADNSPKGQLVKKLTGMNPITKFIMQKQNMEGKNVIGISAVGEKIFMGLSYYFNEGIRNSDNDFHYKFSFETNRVSGRTDAIGNGCTKKVNTKITDINLSNFSNLDKEVIKSRFFQIDYLIKKYKRENPDITQEEIEEKIKSDLENYTHADLMISQLLSAATDNAKELILSKINANSSLANIYLHLLIMGYDIKNIVNFMVSPAISLVADILETNKFNEHGKTNIFMSDAIRIAQKNVSIKSYINTRIYEEGEVSKKASSLITEHLVNKLNENRSINDKVEFKNVYDVLMTYSLEEIEHLLTEAVQHVYNLLPDASERNRYNRKQFLITSQNFIDDFLTFTEIRKDAIKQYGTVDQLNADLEEFQKIHNSAKETKKLGEFMQMCKEIPSDYSEIMGKINNFESWIERKLANFQYIVTSINSKRVSSSESKEGITFSLDESGNLDLKTRGVVRTILENKPYLSKRYIVDSLRKAVELGILRVSDKKTEYKMDFQKFVTDQEYQTAVINLYDLLKDQFNIYDVVVKSPQYLNGIKGYQVISQLFNKMSVKSQLMNAIRSEMKKDGTYLDSEKISKLEIYAEELLIRHFIKNHDFKYPTFINDQVYDEHLDKVESKETGFSTIKRGSDLMSFKLWVEHNLIPQIIKGEVRLPSSSGEERIIKIEDNYIGTFLKTGSEHSKVVKKMKISAKQIEQNTEAQLQFKMAMDSLSKLDINNPKIDGEDYISLKDSLMLYALIAYRNSPGNDRISILFNNELLNNKSEKNLLQLYLDEISQLDYNHSTDSDEDIMKFLKETLLFDMDTALFKMSSVYSYKNKHSILDKNYFIREPDGTLTFYKDKQVYNGWGFLSDPSKVKERMYNIMTDGVLFQPNIDESEQLFNLIKSDNTEDIIKVINKLEYLRKVAIRVKC